ncbi:MAG: ribonuclease [Polyangiaceae bacterium]|jgi:membrane protein|nr:ribonuclease [Polyangiaceae bacterium]
MKSLLWGRHGAAIKRAAKTVYYLVDEAVDGYSRDRAEMVAAGLAFYTLLSMAPLIIIAVAIAGTLLGEGRARDEALRLVTENMGVNAAGVVDEWVQQASDSGGVASILGFVLLLYTASRLGEQLRAGLNQVWNVDAPPSRGLKATVRYYVKRRLFAFLLVLASGPVLLLVFLSRALLSGFYDALFADTALAGPLVQLSQLAFSLVLVGAMSGIVFKVVPDTPVGVRSAMLGGAVTSVLFNVGNALVGLYLGRASVAQTYGAAGSAVVVLLWLYFSSQIFLFGAELTQAYDRRYGTEVLDSTPASAAVGPCPRQE